MGKKDDAVEVMWEIEDGYAGPSRPQYAYIPHDELMDCSTTAEVLDLIGDYVKAAFDDRISWAVSSRAERDVIELWKDLKEQNGEES